jgi:PTH1 family peptidyl-tRNA hydrolase
MKLIVGLGNPGRRYVNTRHNAGFRCVSYFARRQGISLNRRRSKSRLGEGRVDGTKVILARPGTFMNLSGNAVSALLHYYRLPTTDLLVIYDDLALPLGKIRIRERGSSGGHKGMKSIISCLGSQDFPRIRVGISPQITGESNVSKELDAIQYVLSDFTAEEKSTITEAYSQVADAVYCIITEGIAAAMNRFN